MAVVIGQIEGLYRYPVKSMGGQPLDAATLGWQGLIGDRRFAFRRVQHRGDFPWIPGSKFPEIIHFHPQHVDGDREALPTHVRTPEGDELALEGDALTADLTRRCGEPVELMRYKHNIFDEAPISVITSATVRDICERSGVPPDVRRFRPNILVRSERAVPLEEDEWVGGLLRFGDDKDAPAVSVMMRDLRCAMVNFDPAGGPHAPAVMKTVSRMNENHCGVYATVTSIGRLAVGQTITLHR